MKRKWEPEVVEVALHAIPENEYQARIAQVAEILYLGLCQLRKESSQAKPTGSVVPQTERTGTHG